MSSERSRRNVREKSWGHNCYQPNPPLSTKFFPGTRKAETTGESG